MKHFRWFWIAVLLTGLSCSLWAATETMTVKVAHPSPTTAIVSDLVIGPNSSNDRLMMGNGITETSVTPKVVIRNGSVGLSNTNTLDVQDFAGLSYFSVGATTPISFGSPGLGSPKNVNFYGNVTYNHDGMTQVAVGTSASTSLASTALAPDNGWVSPTTVGPITLPIGYHRVIATGLWDNDNTSGLTPYRRLWRGAAKVELKDVNGNVLRMAQAQAYAQNGWGYPNTSGNPNYEGFYLTTTIYNSGATNPFTVKLDLYGCDSSNAGASAVYCVNNTNYLNVVLRTENDAPTGTVGVSNSGTEY